jgi:hypothetical protein
MRFNELKGLEGIDTLLECAPYVDEIFGDKDIFNTSDIGSFGEVAISVYKAHKDAVNKLFDIMDIKPERSTEIIMELITMLSDILRDAETASFFTSTSTNLKSWLSLMANSRGEQSADLSGTQKQELSNTTTN